MPARPDLCPTKGRRRQRQPEAITLDQLFDSIVLARQGDLQTGQQLYAAMQKLAGVLIRILIGDGEPDLSGLTDELREAVFGLLERLGGMGTTVD